MRSASAVNRPSLSDIGEIAKHAAENIPHVYKSVIAGKYVVVPNHIHQITKF
jgi:hypothetical protein